MGLIRIIITSRCNLNCFYCHREGLSGNTSDISLEKINKITKILKDTLLKPQVTLTGGEPTLHPYLSSIIFKLYEVDINVGITTNGTNLEPLIESLGYLRKITVSVPSFVEETYQKITGGNLERVIQNYNELKEEYEGTLKVNFVFSRYSLEEMDVLEEMYDYLAPSYFNVLPLVGDYREKVSYREIVDLFKGRGYRVKEDEKEIVLTRQQRTFYLRKPRFSKFCTRCKLKSQCGERGYVRIFPDGSVSPCLYRVVNFHLTSESLRSSIGWWEECL